MLTMARDEPCWPAPWFILAKEGMAMQNMMEMIPRHTRNSIIVKARLQLLRQKVRIGMSFRLALLKDGWIENEIIEKTHQKRKEKQKGTKKRFFVKKERLLIPLKCD
jgi:hypothetical protein